jgi:hypothetical protein
MSVVSLRAERDRRETEAWDRYVAAKTLADDTHNIEHGRAAAKAWGEFIDLFATPTQAEFIGNSVERFGRRA